MKNIVYIDKEKLLNNSISDEAFCVLVALNTIIHKDCCDYFVNYNSLAYYIFGRKASAREKDNIVNGLNELLTIGCIKKVYEITKTDAIYDLSPIITDINDSYYVKVRKTEIRAIMNINTQKNKYRMLRYYIYLISTFNNSGSIAKKYRNKVGFMTQEYICSNFGINVDTLRDYNEVLEKNNIIYIVRHLADYKKYTNHNSESRVKKISNTYSRYEDKDLCDEYAGNVKSAKNSINAKVSVNNSRSLKQKYNAMLKGKIYPNDVAAEVFGFISNINQERKDKGEDLLDVSVFESYGLK